MEREPIVPIIEQPDPPVRQQISKTLGRHVEATLVAVGVVIGALTTIVAVLVASIR